MPILSGCTRSRLVKARKLSPQSKKRPLIFWLNQKRNFKLCHHFAIRAEKIFMKYARPYSYPELIIFDWDGTLIDSIEHITDCLQQAGQACGLSVPDRNSAKNVIGLSIRIAMASLYPESDELLQDHLVSVYSRAYHARKITKADLFPGVYDMLNELKQQGCRLAVATGKNRPGLERALQATETEALFCITRCADETASKPDPKMLHEILQHTRIAPERTLMVGDSIHDLQMAANAHISFVAVACGAHSHDYLQQFKPLLCLQQPADLLTYLR
jgi:phosphoglycolate phosphatase